jgi:CheY-like chemotaxis protein/two-component sensor histidine kinase
MEEALRDADHRKDEFLATLAHELRNPLAAVSNGVQLMRLANGDGPAIEQARAMMERQLSQLVRLVDDLLDVSRITRGKLQLCKERVELTRVLQQALESSGPLIGAAHHELTVTIPPERILVEADVNRLAQVFSNLLNNAAKYTPEGGRIWLKAERQGSDVVVAVRDTGTGIPPAMLPRIFEMFTQVDRPLERAEGGLGIGLTLVKRLVEMHGGTVEALSEGQGKGTEFVVRLPAILGTQTQQPATAKDETQPSGPRCRILVVDDNRDSADSLAILLDLMGNEVATAYDGLEAIAVAESFRPDTILLDIGLPRLNGYETARRIREQPWSKGVVLIALTGWGQEEDRRRSREAGFDQHLVKPIDPAMLRALLAGLQPAV